MLTQKMQIQAIADRLAGLATNLHARNLTEPWRTCWLALDNATPGQEQLALAQAIRDHPDRNAIMGAIFSARPGDPLGDFPSLQQMHDTGMLPPVEWLWKNWLPLRMLSLLAGEPAAGKSMLALDLAGRIVGSRHLDPTFPDGAPVPCPGAPVIYVDAEDTPSVHDHRSLAWGLDRQRLFLMLPQPDELFVDLNWPQTRDRLVEMVVTLQPALVIVDSLSSISLKGENNKEDVVQLLGFLKRIAESFNCAMLLIHHLRKPGPQVQGRLLSMADVRGSGHIVAAARSVLGVSIVQTHPEPDKNGPRRLEILKTNLTRYPPPLGFELAPLAQGATSEWVHLVYGQAPRKHREPTKAEQCAGFILALLAETGEPMKPAEIIALAKEKGYSRAMVYRVKEELEGEISSTGGRRDPNNRWALAERQEPNR